MIVVVSSAVQRPMVSGNGSVAIHYKTLQASTDVIREAKVIVVRPEGDNEHVTALGQFLRHHKLTKIPVWCVATEQKDAYKAQIALGMCADFKAIPNLEGSYVRADTIQSWLDRPSGRPNWPASEPRRLRLL